MKNIFDGLNRFFHRKMSPKVAQKILGPNFFNVYDVSYALGHLPFGRFEIPYSQETLKKCAEQNKDPRNFNWKLIPKLGLPPSYLRNLFPKEFHQSSVFHFSPDWIHTPTIPMYLLVNFIPFMKGAGERHCLEAIQKNPAWARLKISTVLEMTLALKKLGDRNYLRGLLYCGDQIDGVTPFIRVQHQKILLYTLPTESLMTHGLSRSCTFICLSPELEIK